MSLSLLHPDLIDHNKLKFLFAAKNNERFSSVDMRIHNYLGKVRLNINWKDFDSPFSILSSKSMLLTPYLYGTYAIINTITLRTNALLEKCKSIAIFDYSFNFIEAVNDELLLAGKTTHSKSNPMIDFYLLPSSSIDQPERFLKSLKELLFKQSIYFNGYQFNSLHTTNKRYNLIYLSLFYSSFLDKECNSIRKSPEMQLIFPSLINANNNFFKLLINALIHLEPGGSLVLALPGITNMFTVSILEITRQLFSSYVIEQDNIKVGYLSLCIIFKNYNPNKELLQKAFQNSESIDQTKVALPDFLENKSIICQKVPLESFTKINKDFLQKIIDNNTFLFDESLSDMNRTDEEIQLQLFDICNKYGFKLKDLSIETLMKKNNQYLFSEVVHKLYLVTPIKKKPIDVNDLYQKYYNISYAFNKRDITNYNNIKTLVKLYKNDLKYEVSKMLNIYKNKKSVTQAWLKMWEMLVLLKNKKFLTGGRLETLHLAEAPGNFIWAIEYFCSKHNIELDWHGQSIRHGLEDTYKIMENNPERWDVFLDGDIMNKKVLNYYSKYDVDLLTNDAGIEWLDNSKEECERLQEAVLQSVLTIRCKNAIVKLMLCNITTTENINLMLKVINSFAEAYFYKSCQNEFSPEVYLILIDRIVDPVRTENQSGVRPIDFNSLVYHIDVMIDSFVMQCKRNLVYLDHYHNQTKETLAQIDAQRNKQKEKWKIFYICTKS